MSFIRGRKLERIIPVLVLFSMIITAGLSACLPEGPPLAQQLLQHGTPESAEPHDEGVEEPIESAEAEALIRGEEIVIGLLLLAAIISIVTQYLRIPYTVGLVLVGFGLTFLGRLPFLQIAPELILILLVPPLVFEAAFHINFNELRRDLGFISLLAIPGVILTTFLVGWLVSFGAGIPFASALVFGSLIAATDPVAVVSLFRTLGVPKRLQLLLEGESLFNDGTAIVLFSVMVGIALTGEFSITESLLEFVIVAGGGILVGVLLGVIFAAFTRSIDDHLVETALTTILAYGAYLVAEPILGVSGVLAVVAAGLSIGNIDPGGMSPTTRIVVFNFWEFAAFLANSMVFLLIGLQINIPLLLENVPAILWAILAVLIARVVGIFGFSLLGRRISFRWKTVLFWGGLRGAISLALALSLPTALSSRDQLQAMAFGVVLFSVIVQGLTMGPQIRRLGLVVKSVERREYERRHAKAVAYRNAVSHLRHIKQQGLLSEYTWQTLQPHLEERSKKLAEKSRQYLSENPELGDEEFRDAWREFLLAQRSSLAELHQGGIISEETYSELVAEVDFALDDIENTWPGLPQLEEEQFPEIRKEDKNNIPGSGDKD